MNNNFIIKIPAPACKPVLVVGYVQSTHVCAGLCLSQSLHAICCSPTRLHRDGVATWGGCAAVSFVCMACMGQWDIQIISTYRSVDFTSSNPPVAPIVHLELELVLIALSLSEELQSLAVLCDSSRDSDSSPFYSDSDSSPVFFTLTRTRLRTQKSWLGPKSRPSPSSSSRAVLRCLLWHSIHFVVCFHVLEDKQMLNMWTTRFMTRNQTRTLRWWLGLGLGFDNLDSDTAPVIRLWELNTHKLPAIYAAR